MFLPLLQPAADWEFRWRIPIMFGSLPAFALLATAAGEAGRWYAPTPSLSIRLWAAGLAASGLALRLAGTAELSAAAMLRNEVTGVQLVDRGPFNMVRNPLYLGTQLVIGGWSCWYGAGPAAFFVLLHLLRFERIVRREEQELHAVWGPVYVDYCGRVPRWLPRPRGWPREPRGWTPETRGRPRWPLPWRIAPGAWFSNAPFVAMTAALVAAAARVGATAAFFPMLGLGLAMTGSWLVVRTARSKQCE